MKIWYILQNIGQQDYPATAECACLVCWVHTERQSNTKPASISEVSSNHQFWCSGVMWILVRQLRENSPYFVDSLWVYLNRKEPILSELLSCALLWNVLVNNKTWHWKKHDQTAKQRHRVCFHTDLSVIVLCQQEDRENMSCCVVNKFWTRRMAFSLKKTQFIFHWVSLSIIAEQPVLSTGNSKQDDLFDHCGSPHDVPGCSCWGRNLQHTGGENQGAGQTDGAAGYPHSRVQQDHHHCDAKCPRVESKHWGNEPDTQSQDGQSGEGWEYGWCIRCEADVVFRECQHCSPQIMSGFRNLCQTCGKPTSVWTFAIFFHRCGVLPCSGSLCCNTSDQHRKPCHLQPHSDECRKWVSWAW